MTTGSRVWEMTKKPFAAVLGVEIGAICAMVATQAQLVEISPGSIVFITVLLVDVSSSEAFYVTAVYRFFGTVIGLLVGGGVSFLSNVIVDETSMKYGLELFQLCCLGLLVFIPLVIQKIFPRYSYACVIFIFTITSLVFSGTSNDITIATIVSVVGGVSIATIIMRIFNYESAEKSLFRQHRELLGGVLAMVRYGVHANSTYKDEYFQILEDSKSAFSVNVDNINSYKRWLRWTRQTSPFDFISLTKALRPVYHQSASLFWSLCRDRVVAIGSPSSDPSHLYCETPELYFDNFHMLVVGMVTCLDNMQSKLETILHQPPNWLLGTIKRTLRKKNPVPETQRPKACDVMSELLKEDAWGLIKALIQMKARYFELKAVSHKTFSQQWLISDFMYQLGLVYIELFDYLLIVTENLVSDERKKSALSKRIRSFIIHLESMSRDGFLHAKSFEEAGNSTTDLALLLDSHQSEADDQDGESVLSEKDEPDGHRLSVL